jgi:hypothetical protein
MLTRSSAILRPYGRGIRIALAELAGGRFGLAELVAGMVPVALVIRAEVV